MTTKAGEISIEISGNKAKLDTVLRGLERDLKRASDSAGLAADALGTKVAAGQDKAARAALAHARAEASLKATTGDLTGAIRGLSSALDGVDKNSTAAVRAQTQLARLQKDLASDGGAVNRVFKDGAGSVVSFASSLGLATTALGATLALVGRVQEGFKLQGAISDTKNSLGVLLGSQEKANQTFADATAFGDKYKIKVSEINTALGGMGTLLRESTTGTQKQLEVLARMQALAPGKTFSDAAFSAKELASLDYTSISEQFNISKAAARGLRDEVAGGADVFQVLDKYLNSVGASVGVLETRLQGAGGATRSYEKSQEDLNLALGQFAQGPGVQALDILTRLTNGLTAFATAGAQGGGLNTSAFAKAAGDFAAYQTQFQQFDAAIKEQTKGDPIGEWALRQTIGLQQLNQAQFQYASTLVAQGVAEQEAIARAQALQGTSEALALVQQQLVLVDAERAASLGQLAPLILQASGASDAARATAEALTQRWLENALTGDQFRVALLNLIAAEEANAQATANAAAEDSRRAGVLGLLASGSDQATNATQINTDALIEQTQKSQEASLQTQQLSQFQALLANLGGAVAGGLQTSANAAIIMANAYGIATGEAERLIRAQAALGQAKVNAAALTDQRAGERGGGTSQTFAQISATKDRDRADAAAQRRYIEATETQSAKVKRLQGDLAGLRKGSAAYTDTLIKLNSAQAAGSRAGGGGGGGRAAGAGGVSPQVKAAEKEQQQLTNAQETEQNKREDSLAKYELDRLKITQDYAEKRLDAERKLGDDLADTNASFYDSLINLEDQGVAKQYDAQFQSVLAGLPAIAAEKGADVADAYLAAEESALKAQAGRAAEIAAAEKKGDAGRAEALRGVDGLYRASEQRKIDAVLNRTDTIAGAEQKALGESAANYEQADAKITISSDRATEKIERNTQARIDALDRDAKAAGKVADQYARIDATAGPGAASSSGTSASTADASGASTSAAPSESGNLQALAQIKNAVDGLREQLVSLEKTAGRGLGDVESAVRASAPERLA